MKKDNTPSLKAFSILELAISITIIALIVTSVTVGVNIKNKLELSEVINDISEISTAVETFKETHGALPGDMFNAQAVFGVANTFDGNGDNDLEDTSPDDASSFEDLLFWQHLALAGLINGSYDGTTNGIGGRMEGPLKYSLYDAQKTTESGTLIIQVSKASSNGLFTTKQAYDYDIKYDDSNPTTGAIQAADAADASAGDCVNTGTTPESYNLGNNAGEPCVMRFVID